MVEQQADRVMLGIMSNPMSPRLRAQLREWNARFRAYRSTVDVRFVFGSSFYNGSDGFGGGAPMEAVVGVQAEESTHHDLFFVNGRERLPHVGVVTEKSAAYWREVGSKHPGYAFYCKSDDDTMVHLDRLQSVLSYIASSEGSDRPVYLGHMKWRGWDVGKRFQACGGSWGNAVKTASDILSGGVLPGGVRYPPCPHAAGPYPYMSGGMVCMSRALQRLVAADKSFGDFLTVAKARNDFGERCKRPTLCAAQPAATHMWHHEDAGIGFNVFRAVVAANASASIVPVPGHFNDPGIIERTPSPQDTYWSSRALFVHGVKARHHYETAVRRWTLDRSSEHLTLSCERNCSMHGVGAFSWEWARLPCPRVSWHEPQPGRFCAVDPSHHYRCCGFPWVVPELRSAILTTLAAAPGQRLGVAALGRRTAKEVARTAVETPACTGGCARVEVPGGAHMHAVLDDLHARGDLRYSGAGAERPEPGREVWLIPR